jgi:hypothetical protein
MVQDTWQACRPPTGHGIFHFRRVRDDRIVNPVESVSPNCRFFVCCCFLFIAVRPNCRLSLSGIDGDSFVRVIMWCRLSDSFLYLGRSLRTVSIFFTGDFMIPYDVRYVNIWFCTILAASRTSAYWRTYTQRITNGTVHYVLFLRLSSLPPLSTFLSYFSSFVLLACNSVCN